jgi:hypothetical protein
LISCTTIGEIKFSQYDPRPAKRIGLDDVAAYAEKIRVNIPNNVGGG